MQPKASLSSFLILIRIQYCSQSYTVKASLSLFLILILILIQFWTQTKIPTQSVIVYFVSHPSLFLPPFISPPADPPPPSVESTVEMPSVPGYTVSLTVLLA